MKIYLFLFPNYENIKFSFEIKNDYLKLQFINNNSFFYFGQKTIGLYSINDKNNTCSLIAQNKITINNPNSSLINLNNDYYLINDNYKIYIFKKQNLDLVKTININDYEKFYLLKISQKLFSIFTLEYYRFNLINYQLSMNGLKWDNKNYQNISNEGYSNSMTENKYILFMNEYKCSLYEIIIKKEENNS